MPQPSRIPTPLKQHLHRFRVGLLPVMSFFLCVMVTVWLWQRQGMSGTVMGEIEGEVFDITAGVDGELRPLPGRETWQLFDTVKKGDTIALLDDSLIQARMETVRRTAEQLREELGSTTAEFDLQQFDLDQRRHGDALRLRGDVSRMDLQWLQLRTTSVALEAQLSALAADLKRLEEFRKKDVSLVDEMDYRELQRERETVRGQLDGTLAEMQAIKTLRSQLLSRLDEFPNAPDTKVETLLAPIQREIEVQEKLLGEIQVELDNCVIRSPIDGVITAVWRRPGQRVGAADPIVTVSSSDSKYVLGYVRDQQRIPLYKGMEVSLRLGNQPYGPEYASEVESVSPQVAPLPLRRLADQNVMEFATWIRIPIPTEMQRQNPRPGQRVTVILRPSRSFE